MKHVIIKVKSSLDMYFSRILGSYLKEYELAMPVMKVLPIIVKLIYELYPVV